MKQILVAVDEHPHAEQIVDAAIQLAEATSAKILLIYVVSAKTLPSGYRESDQDNKGEDFYEDEYLRAVGPLLERIEKAGIAFEGINSKGNPEQQILKDGKNKARGLHSGGNSRAAAPESARGHRQRLEKRHRELDRPRVGRALSGQTERLRLPQAYLLTKFGFLFSRKALIPSFLSAVSNRSSKSVSPSSKPDERPIS